MGHNIYIYIYDSRFQAPESSFPHHISDQWRPAMAARNKFDNGPLKVDTPKVPAACLGDSCCQLIGLVEVVVIGVKKTISGGMGAYLYC